jgi:hypothetical protein
MRRWSQLFIISAFLVALAIVAAPWFAMRALQAAARDGDVQALAELIDYPAVRAGLRADPQAGALEAPASVWSDPVGAVRHALERRRPAPPEGERYLTPAGLHLLAGPPEFGHEVRHWGPNRVRFAVRAGERVSLFTFQRRGVFRWRLVHLAPPPVAAGFRPATAPAPPR